MTMSELKFYSLGLVAEDKKLSSKVVEVTPIEDLSMLDGDLNSTQKSSQVDSEDGQGNQEQVKVNTANSVPATWLPLGSSNLFTAPDVRRGARVMLYKFSDEEKYYWTTLQADLHLRKLETTIYAWSGTKEEFTGTREEQEKQINQDNYYFLEVSTHKGITHFHTSKANGEFCSFDVQINSKDGFIKIQDDTGQFFVFNAKEKQFALKNSEGCYIEINKKNMTINVPELLTINAKNLIEKIGEAISIDAGKTIDIKAGDSITEKTGTFSLDASGTVSLKSGGLFTINGNGVKISKKVALS